MALISALAQLAQTPVGTFEYTVALIAAITGLQEPETGWVLCNGATLPVGARYDPLRTMLGSSVLPTLIDGVQPVARGASAYPTIGATDGARLVTLGLAHITPHTHLYPNNSVEVFVGSFGYADFGDPPGTGDRSNDTLNPGYQMDAAGGGGAHNNMPPYIVVEGMLVKL